MFVEEEKQKEVVPLVSKHVVKVRLEKSPSLGLQDSAVQDEMLQQVIISVTDVLWID